MATESKVFLNDPSLLGGDVEAAEQPPVMQEGQPAAAAVVGPHGIEDSANATSRTHDPEPLTQAQEMLIDQFLSSESTSNLDSSSQKESHKTVEYSSSTSNDEHVESPTTRESFTFKCVFCDRVLNASDNPKLLECLHNTCSACLDGRLYEHGDSCAVQCPLCAIPCDPNRIIDNQFLLELSLASSSASNEESPPKVTDLKCSSCSDDAVATSYCTDCSEFICDNCVQAHQRLKITKDHTIKTKDEGVMEQNAVAVGSPNNMFCQQHPHEKLSLFCETCDVLTCRDCQLIEHREHKYKFTNEIASEAKKFIGEMLKDVGYKRALLTSAMKVIDDRQNLITEKKHALVKEITQLVVKLTNTINVRGKQLVSKLSEVCDSKQKTLQEKKQALEQLSKMTDHCIQFTQHALDNGSDMALLYSKRQVTEHLKRIKCKRADIPNPEIPVRIHLALDKVPDLIKVMSTIGQIVVDGRIYPSQSPQPQQPQLQQSPSPGLGGRPPQQMSPIAAGQMHHQMTSPTTSVGGPQAQGAYQQQARMPYGAPSPQHQQYGQYGVQQQQQGIGQQSQQQVSRMGPPSTNMGVGGPPPPPPQAIPISLAQQLNMNRQQPAQQRPVTMPQRSIMPRMHMAAAAAAQHINQQQQQVSSSTHPHGMLAERSNLRHLLQPNSTNSNNPIYIQTGPGQYQAIQPQHLAQQFQNRFSQQQVRFGGQQQQAQQQQQGGQMRMLMSGQQQQQHLRMQQQQQPCQSRPPPQYQVVGGAGGAKWHTPQQSNATNASVSSGNRGMTLPTINDNFKITLRQQQNTTPSPSPTVTGSSATPSTTGAAVGATTLIDSKAAVATVTSTIPKTPSPNHILQGSGHGLGSGVTISGISGAGGGVSGIANGGGTGSGVGKSDTERNLDKFCEDSVKDLMATIAKLDSNGVQVLAEGNRQKGSSPLVDSSTGDATPSVGGPIGTGGGGGGSGGADATPKIKTELSESSKDDPNEDWCAVCMDGGELVCCDKCPKVFHQYCHIPNLSVEENDTWQCLLCMNFADIPDTGDKKDGELSSKEKKIAERLVLELYCQNEPSLHFREVVGPENTEYHSIIKNPIALDTIRQKLEWTSEKRYRSLENLVKDVRLMFRNAYRYNPMESQVYLDARTLEKFFDEQLEKFLPAYAYEQFDDDDDDHEDEELSSQPPSKKYRRIISD